MLKDLQGKGLKLYWGQLSLLAFVLNSNNYNSRKPLSSLYLVQLVILFTIKLIELY